MEGFNFDARKHLLEYDDVMNKQRLSIYKKRQELLESKSHPQILAMLDMLWMSHLENMEALSESVRLRAYGQHDPLVEYRREGHLLFQQLLAELDQWMAENAEKLKEHAGHNHSHMPQPAILKVDAGSGGEVGRNDPCPCGSGKKYKKCHGK